MVYEWFMNLWKVSFHRRCWRRLANAPKCVEIPVDVCMEPVWIISFWIWSACPKGTGKTLQTSCQVLASVDICRPQTSRYSVGPHSGQVKRTDLLRSQEGVIKFAAHVSAHCKPNPRMLTAAPKGANGPCLQLSSGVLFHLHLGSPFHVKQLQIWPSGCATGDAELQDMKFCKLTQIEAIVAAHFGLKFGFTWSSL